ncbi:MAG: TetR/AcrR family transcriptional regulator [Bacteroidales bacterium]|nr:TetR/AcrR family transcriptional regulator [Bacteroidales bacterium]
MVKKRDTEQKILDAARIVFYKKGMHGTRMQEIANTAGINKALLHYYFRSKEKLYHRILEDAVGMLASGIREAALGKGSFLDKIKLIIKVYGETFSEHPYLPSFFLNEMNQNPDFLKDLILEKSNIDFEPFFQQIIMEMEQGRINYTNPLHLFINVLAIIIFPYAAKPLVSQIMNEKMGVNYDILMKGRDEAVFEFIKNAINSNNT